MFRKSKPHLIAIITALVLVSLNAEALYITSQTLHEPGTVELGAVIHGGLGLAADPLNCVLAGRQTGWTGYRGYLGIIWANQQKLDILAQDGSLTAGSDSLLNCQSLRDLVTDGTSFQQLVILNRFGQIWYRLEPY